MEFCNFIFLFFSVQFLILHPTSHAQLLSIVEDHANSTQIYIIDVAKPEHHQHLSDEDLKSWHTTFLPNSTLDSGAPRLIYSYRHVISGFAAQLTRGELEAIKSKPSFLHAQRNRLSHLPTTYTPRYLGVTSSNVWGSTNMGEGIIIGIVDSGITPNHPSFDDSKMPAPPPNTVWKGNCSYPGFKCNNKIIGAKAFKSGQNPSPVDTDGHGTHVASIAAGSFVKNANVLGMAQGTASGMAPMAYISIYRVCFPGCLAADCYAGIDQAIKDGVHVLSLSLPGFHNDHLYEDAVARGSMVAIQNNIFPVTAAGNDGPDSLIHSAPWMLIVGATTTDRRITSIVELGNGQVFFGESAYQPNNWISNVQRPLVYPGLNGGTTNVRCCLPKALANFDLRGKIVVCEEGLVGIEVKGKEAIQAGAMGMIIVSATMGYNTVSGVDVLPTAYLNYPDGSEVLNYCIKNVTNGTASISFNGTNFGYMPSPAVATFSSRGPSQVNGGIIKPDIVAPGVNILGAWFEDVGPNPNPLATHTFNIKSGTSMATPHVGGIAALVRKKHRDWTPSEILSAFITTANDSWTVGSPDNLLIDEISNLTASIYARGAGLVNPIKALDPGLVFGQTVDDYIGYLCGLGYTDQEVLLTTGISKSCSTVKQLSATELNYPSIAVNLTRTKTSQIVRRTTKNVGNVMEEYTAYITDPIGLKIYLSTYKLKFTREGQKLSYDMTFAMADPYPSPGSPLTRSGKIVWDSGVHRVTTPIVVRFV